jgi:putative hydrolase of HD superfamily
MAAVAYDGRHESIAALLFEMGVLKRVHRSGWAHAGIRHPETVAEHSLRAAQVAGVLATMEGADPAKAAYLAIWHDSQETRTGDLPHSAHAYITGPDPQVITADQTASIPQPIAENLRKTVAEFEAGTTLETLCAKDADKLECLLQAIEYQVAGNSQTQRWIDSCYAALKTDSARQVAEAALSTSPLAWRGR